MIKIALQKKKEKDVFATCHTLNGHWVLSSVLKFAKIKRVELKCVPEVVTCWRYLNNHDK